MTRHRRHSILLAVGVLLGAPALLPIVGPAAAATNPTSGVSFRAVLCFAPLKPSAAASHTGALPACASRYRLTAKNLGVHPNDSASGFSRHHVAADPQFRDDVDSSGTALSASSQVLLSGIKGGPPQRYVLGPTRLNASSIRFAEASLQSGQWVVTYQLTKSGSSTWNAFAKSQFHEYIAIVAGGKVYAAPIIQPSLSGFTSFEGSGEVAGNFTASQADALAAAMTSPT